jgi:hypothetical protein
MKKIILGIILAAFIIMLVPKTEAIGTNQLNITMLKYEPIPAEPGSYIDVWVNMENLADEDANNAALEFIDKYPFTIERAEEKIEMIDLPAGQSYVAKFRVRVDNDAIEGISKLKFRFTADTGIGSWIEKEFSIDVRTLDAIISINSVEIEPTPLLPGSQASIKIKVKNLADSVLKDVSVKLDFDKTYSAATLLNDPPFVPLGSTSEKKIKLIRGGETSLFVFDIIVYPDAETKIYKVPLTISFYDEVGTAYTQEDLLGIVVEDEPSLIISVSETELTSSKSTGEIRFELVNKGFGDIKFMTVTLEETDYLEVLSTSNKEYIGTIDSDDYETAEFDVRLNADSDVIEFPLKLEYKDALNNNYEETVMVKLNVANQKTNGEGNKTTGIIVTIIIVVVVVIGFFIIRKRRKKKRG